MSQIPQSRKPQTPRKQPRKFFRRGKSTKRDIIIFCVTMGLMIILVIILGSLRG